MNAKEIKENFVPEKIQDIEYGKAKSGGIMIALKGKTAYLDTEDIHTLVIGTTCSGKG